MSGSVRKTWKRRLLPGAASSALALALGGWAVAAPDDVPLDRKDDQEKQDQEWREAEKGQRGGQQPGEGGAPGGGMGMDNPLEKILELMRGVEDRLFEADTGTFTQEEQKQIVEAMRFETKTAQELEELIRKVEEQAQKQQSQSSSSQQDQQQQKNQQQRPETEEERRERERREQERMRRQQEEERRRQAQQQPQDQQQQPQNDQQTRDQQQRREGQPPPGGEGDLNDPSGGAARWGQLPRKLHQDAANARNHEPPSRWRELIERYRERLADQQD